MRDENIFFLNYSYYPIHWAILFPRNCVNITKWSYVNPIWFSSRYQPILKEDILYIFRFIYRFHIGLAVYSNRFTCFNVQQTHYLSHNTHCCSTSFHPLSKMTHCSSCMSRKSRLTAPDSISTAQTQDGTGYFGLNCVQWEEDEMLQPSLYKVYALAGNAV